MAKKAKMSTYKCEVCRHEEQHKTEKRNPMYRDCPECNTRVGMKAVSPFTGINIKRYGTDTEPSKYEIIKNRPRGDF